MIRSPGCILCLMALCTILRVVKGNQCLTELEEVTPKRVVQEEGRSLDIRFELSTRITQRLVSRIMKIFLIEVLGYPGIKLIEKDDNFDSLEVFERLSHSTDLQDICGPLDLADTVFGFYATAFYFHHSVLTLPGVCYPWRHLKCNSVEAKCCVEPNRVARIQQKSRVPDTMVNMEVWIPGQMDTILYLEGFHVNDCGSVGPVGYFGWFVPRSLWRSNMTETWHIFSNRDSSVQFNVDDQILKLIKMYTLKPGSKDEHYCSDLQNCQDGIYVPEQCQDSNSCAMLLAGDPNVTYFVKESINKLKLYVKVAWVGTSLKNLLLTITDIYNETNTSKSLVMLHWTPSEVIPNDEDFISIGFPRCRNSDGFCKYVDNKLVKVVWSRLESIATVAYTAIKKASFTNDNYQDLIKRYNNKGPNNTEDNIACDWLRDNLNSTLLRWKPRGNNKKALHIGGIFPMTGEKYKARSILLAAQMANIAINSNNTILRDYALKITGSDGQCKADMVMKSFIEFIMSSKREPLIGILGPACSETVEPLIGVSKQYSTMVISYSAEGSNFDDREKYPYFFRTISENIHYKHVYLSLLEKMKWRRVAALTEDGQKYTEYISHMQYYLQNHNITFIDNAKYPRERERDLMFKNLENLKKKRARIIIADVDDVVARHMMCDAYKLEMTAYQGYVWFLPLWLLPGWWNTDFHNMGSKEPVLCKTSEMMKAVNGYLGISHAYYAPDDSIMQENITVREWRNIYENQCKRQNQIPSDYAGFAYDATWTYAYAMDQLLSENGSYVFALQSPHTANRLTEIISRTDFNGVSGRIKFLNGASRISSVDIVQYVNNETIKIGIFQPNVSENSSEVIGGNLDINMSAIVWLTPDGLIPNDGSEPEVKCVFASLAEFLDVTCEIAIVVVNIIVFGLLGILLIIGFVIIKRKYDKKVRLHEKYMKSLGIDLLQTDTTGLDKWEIPRECVVINRKLGEGAFGTVYGGEAFFTEKGWLAVAVKTLKVGSSTEEKLDFLSEVEVMKRFEHKNIIKLLGVCIKCEPVYTVMEFMLYGDLKTYLLARRHLVNDRNYEDYDEISSKKLTAMALDVARALSYLAQLKYVHRDIASRNCLVNAQRVVKLGDFGMTRPMYENDYYKFNRKGMLPVRWMAPESLGLGIFTPASDVWSYGVLLYEIITFGSFPFQGLSNNEVLEHVKSGNTITIPTGIKAPLENLIRSCWTIEHKARPSAPEIVDFLATNPRLLSPCLDVPLASVQLEHTGQIEMQLPEKFRKFSVSLSKNNQSSSKLTSNNSPCEIPLMGIKEDGSSNDPSFITARLYDSGSSAMYGDSSRPLLRDSDGATSKYVKLQRNVNNSGNDNELSARYVNIQPGIEGNDIDNISTDRRILVDDQSVNNEEDESGNDKSRMSLL